MTVTTDTLIWILAVLLIVCAVFWLFGRRR